MITPVIAVRNDKRLHDTIESMRVGYHGRIIVVDDCSDVPVVVNDPDVEVVRTPNRFGPALAKHTGAEMVKTPWMLLSDSHMVYQEDWYDVACDELRQNYDSIFGAVYHQSKIDNPFWHDTHDVAGADPYWWRHKDDRFSFMDIEPRRWSPSPLTHDVPCLLGGCYFISKKFWDRISGFSQLLGYGSEELWLSWHAWLSGGGVEVMGRVKTTHILDKNAAHSRTIVPEWEFNKLTILKMVLSADEYDTYMSWLPVDTAIKQVIEQRFGGIRLPKYNVKHERLCALHGLQTFDEAINLMREFATFDGCKKCYDRRWRIFGTRLLACPVCNPDGTIRPKSTINTLEIIP